MIFYLRRKIDFQQKPKIYFQIKYHYIEYFDSYTSLSFK
jgi:hypothetical protein